MSNVKSYLARVAVDVDATLEKLLPAGTMYPNSIHEVMRYSMFAGGKRIRPALIMAAFEACGGPYGDERALKVGAAYEMLHTFSLIHDDLPCMDDDDFRRGRPTAHRAFTEALAVLGGDALCIYAYEILAQVNNMAVITEISKALGTQGMIGGQVVDIESEGKPVTRENVEYIHMNKTAAFIRACMRTGALLASADATTVNKLTHYGELTGLAFQVVDDILDEEGTTEQLGKDAGSDRANGKATYPAVIGMAESKKIADDLTKNAIAEIEFLGDKGELLKEMALLIRNRIS